jgi:hypothetical protein
MEQHQQQDLGQRWMHFMKCGQFEKAWTISDHVLKQRAGKPTWHLPRHQQAIWNGQSLKGKRVLVRCYHGLGDTIQFIRYAPLLRGIASKVMVWVQPSLIPLLENIPGIDELHPLHHGTIAAEFDVDIEVMELPHIFRSTIHTLPVSIPYIQVHQPEGFTQQLLDQRQLNIGLVWKPGPYAPERSVPFTELAPLASVPGIRLHILQSDAKACGWTEGFGIYPGDFSLYDYARYVKGLDLLISVDSMPVHLAGAMGVPTFALLHSPADWRWMYHGSTTPWYPSVRLFRQQQTGNWKSVITHVTAELHKLVRKQLPLKVAA